MTKGNGKEMREKERKIDLYLYQYQNMAFSSIVFATLSVIHVLFFVLRVVSGKHACVHTGGSLMNLAGCLIE